MGRRTAASLIVDGRISVLQGSTARHNRIATNIHARLTEAARLGSCAAYAIDPKVHGSRDRVYYPDVVLVCAEHGGDTLIIDEPWLDPDDEPRVEDDYLV
jgi:Uma2 family endonuclease